MRNRPDRRIPPGRTWRRAGGAPSAGCRPLSCEDLSASAAPGAAVATLTWSDLIEDRPRRAAAAHRPRRRGKPAGRPRRRSRRRNGPRRRRSSSVVTQRRAADTQSIRSARPRPRTVRRPPLTGARQPVGAPRATLPRRAAFALVAWKDARRIPPASATAEPHRAPLADAGGPPRRGLQLAGSSRCEPDGIAVPRATGVDMACGVMHAAAVAWTSHLTHRGGVFASAFMLALTVTVQDHHSTSWPSPPTARRLQ